MPDHPSLRHSRGRLATLLGAAAVLGASLLAAPPAHAAPAGYGTLSLTADASVTVGDTVTFTVDADSVTDLYAYDLVIGYDPALLQLDAATAVFPEGGFDSVGVTAGTDAATLTHTRLGSSPGLIGPQRLVSMSFTSLAPGSAEISLLAGTAVGTAGESTPIAVTPALSATSLITAAPAPEPTPAPPADQEQPATGSGSAPDAAGSSAPSGRLATTGVDPSPWIAAGVMGAGLVVLGTVLISRRREATR